MNQQVSVKCLEHPEPVECPDRVISYLAKFAEYGLVIHDGGSSMIQISHCPWCGSALPASRRDEWFARLEAMGFDDPSVQEVPSEFLSDKWYRGDSSLS